MIGSRGGDGSEVFWGGGVVERRLRRSVRGRRESNKNDTGLELLFESLFFTLSLAWHEL